MNSPPISHVSSNDKAEKSLLNEAMMIILGNRPSIRVINTRGDRMTGKI